jgi:molybdopterin molybdotransferase
VLATTRPLPAEEVPLLEALGRATAAEIVSPEAVPSFDNSAMDGYAVRGAELAGGRREFKVVVEIPAGRWVGEEVGAGEAAKIMTGAPLPPGVDTVVQVELTEQHGETLVVTETVQPGANVRRAAEDVAVGDVLFPRGARLGPAEIGLLASVSCQKVAVARRPRVAILATGSELRLPGQPLSPGQIRTRATGRRQRATHRSRSGRPSAWRRRQERRQRVGGRPVDGRSERSAAQTHR